MNKKQTINRKDLEAFGFVVIDYDVGFTERVSGYPQYNRIVDLLEANELIREDFPEFIPKEVVWMNKEYVTFSLEEIHDVYLKNILLAIPRGIGNPDMVNKKNIQKLIDEAKKRNVEMPLKEAYQYIDQYRCSRNNYVYKKPQKNLFPEDENDDFIDQDEIDLLWGLINPEKF